MTNCSHAISKPLTEYPCTSSAVKIKSNETDAPLGTLVSFDGQYQPGSSNWPPSARGDVNSGYYVQTVQGAITVYTRSGQAVWGPVPVLQIFGSLPGTSGITWESIPQLIYDSQANRWFLAVMTRKAAYPVDNFYLLAVSASSNPAGAWNTYSFNLHGDYTGPTFGVGRDAYYMMSWSFGNGNADVFAFERQAMISGGTARLIGFDISDTWGMWGVDPVDNVGAYAPDGSPGLFLVMNDTVQTATGQQVEVYGLHPDWVNTANSTWGLVSTVPVAKTINFVNTFEVITQKGTSQKLKSPMGNFNNLPRCRNFGSYEAIVCCNGINLDTGMSTYRVGICWYEFRKTGSGPWTLRQQGIVSSPGEHLFGGSISLNSTQTIALGYSVSGGNTFPSIRYRGQSKAAYEQANSVMDYAEDTVLTGRFSETQSSRFGWESSMTVDASNEKMFWYTNEYIDSAQNHCTRIASLRFGKYPVIKTLPATNITKSAARLNGSVNSRGLLTWWRFQWGTSTTYSDSSVAMQSGPGSNPVPVYCDLSGLVLGVTYHYRLIGENADGRIEGEDMTVTPGAAVIKTRVITNVGVSTAISGGDVSSDGGSPVTERGVCWGKNLNPVVSSGNVTTDGPGIGSFVSQIVSLERNTMYHVRAYAVNANGTWYGQDRSFVTLCGNFDFPFNESFTNSWMPECWSNVDYEGKNEVWKFGKMAYADPVPALDGNYAYLNSEEYGSGDAQDADLITPPLDCSGHIDVSLSFDHYYKADPNSTASVAYSLDGGLSWTNIRSFETTSATNPEHFSVLVPEVAGKPAVLFRWKYTGAFSYYWAVDNIRVDGTPVNTISVFPPVEKVNAAPAGSTIFNVTSNAAWSAVSDQSWLTVTPSGTGSGVLQANYQENPSYESRVAAISVSVAGRPSALVYVEQARSTVGVEETFSWGCRVFPNPASEKLWVELENQVSADTRITLSDIRGFEVRNCEFAQSRKFCLDLHGLEPGLYVVSVINQHLVFTSKVILTGE